MAYVIVSFTGPKEILLYALHHTVLPIEVKSGHGSTLRSLHRFLEEHKQSELGMRFWSENYLQNEQEGARSMTTEKIVSRPLDAVATLAHPDQEKALLSLL